MILLDAALRFSGVGFLCLILVCAIGYRGQWRSRPYLIGACISLIALFLGFAVPPLQFDGAALLVLRIIDIPNFIFVWFFTLSFFTSDFKLNKYYVLFSVLYCLLILWVRIDGLIPIPQAPFWMVDLINAVSILILIHLIYKVVSEFNDDVVIWRRNARIIFIVFLVLSSQFSILVQLLGVSPFGLHITTIVIMSQWPTVALAAFGLTRLNREMLLTETPVLQSAPFTAKEAALDAKLRELVEEEMLFKNYDVDIKTTSSKLGVSEYALREHINQKKGFRNYSHFINQHRINYIKAALVDPARADASVSTLAYEGGFKSLASFNRAFKAQVGTTPSEFRRQRS